MMGLQKKIEKVERSVIEVEALLKAMDDMIGSVSVKAGHEQFDAIVVLLGVAHEKAKELDDHIADVFSMYERVNGEIKAAE